MMELKKDDEQFEEYDSDWLFLRAVKYDLNVDYELMKQETISKYV